MAIAPRLKIEGLNALRVFAFLGVFSEHALPAANGNDGIFYRAVELLSSFGSMRIDLFFVLSSFLLTYLALKEKKATNGFSIKNFLIRRALRILPLYYLVIAVCFIFFPLVSKITGLRITLPDTPLYFIFFLNNYDMQDFIFALKAFWSLAIEEQFYWSWALMLKLTGKRVTVVAVFLLVTYCILFYLLPVFNVQAPVNPFMFLANFSIGSLCAIYFFNTKKSLHIGILMVCAVGSFIAWHYLSNYTRINAKLPLSIHLAFVILITIKICSIPQVSQTRVYRIFDNLGKYTYGLYVYGGFVITIVPMALSRAGLASSFYLVFLLEFFLTLAIAIASYQWYEKRFLVYSNRFRGY